MIRDQTRLVRSTFDRLALHDETVSDVFHARLRDLAPDTPSALPAGMGPLATTPLQVIAMAVHGLRDVCSLLPTVQELGHRMRDRDVTDVPYDDVGTALLGTLRELLGEAFTPEVEAAWSDTYGFLATVMRDAQQGLGRDARRQVTDIPRSTSASAAPCMSRSRALP